MGELTFKLGDVYDGYSNTTTREKSLPDAIDAEKLNTGDTNTKAEAITEVTTSNASKKSILVAVACLAVIGLVLGAVRG